jgi:hypothetical protein
MRYLNFNKKKKIFLVLYISLLIFSSLGAINTFYKFTNIESISSDNDTKNDLNTAEAFIFDGMYIDHIYSYPGYSCPSRFSYSYYSGNLFFETWDVWGGSYTWFVDNQTRLMSGGSVFGDGNHTPAWIFTDVSLGDEILIAADAEGDHLFSVAGELIYDLPGFGPVNVWVLEDLTLPGGVAWYEKSTGILLNGTFYYDGGSYWYTFDFVDTNVEFTYEQPETKLFDGMYIDHIYTDPETSEPSRFSYSYYSGSLFFETWDVWGGSYTWYVDNQTRLMSGGSEFGDGTHTPAWIFTNVKLDDKIFIAAGAEGDHLFSVAGELIYDLPGFGPVDVWVLEDLTLPGGVAWYEKSTGILLNGTFYYDGGSSWYTFDFVDTNVEFTYSSFDHDLGVSLEVPTFPEIDNTYAINATVTNIGINDESDINLFLYLDDEIVNSITIPSLLVGESETIDFIWTPTEYKTYNFTAYAPPVPDESYIGNNIKTKLIPIIDTKLFDGMYINHTFNHMDASIGPSQFSYSYLSGEYFRAEWNFSAYGDDYYSYWDVNTQTRIISNVGGDNFFLEGHHTPAWIFTGLSLGDTVPIAVFEGEEHIFNIINELIYDLPDFGLIDVWVLEDLTTPGGIAWYEKSTGILLNGTFYYSGGSLWYTFDFVDTNAEFIYAVPPGDFILSSNAGTPDDDGNFDLTWESADGALTYSVYEYSSFITEINESLTLLGDGITDLSLALSGYTDGTYYFIAVAHNAYGDTLSNCIEVVVGITPGNFVLSSNAGTPDDNGAFDLSWTSAEAALNYSVYRYSEYITEINGSLTLLVNGTEDLTLPLSGYSDGTYYFIVVANNTYGDTLSNCLEVVVQIPQPTPPGNFVLSSNAGTPDDNGAFDLSWTSAAGAVSYSVYEYSSYITEINVSLTLLADGITNLSLALSGYSNGTYYFIAVAHNAYGDTLSNCIEVVVQIPPEPEPEPDPTPPDIPGYNIFIFVPIILVVVMVIIRKQHKKRSQY